MPAEAGIQACGASLVTDVTASCGAEAVSSACGEAPCGENSAVEAKWIPASAGMTVAWGDEVVVIGR
jgi:hypothetical protein